MQMRKSPPKIRAALWRELESYPETVNRSKSFGCRGPVQGCLMKAIGSPVVPFC